MRNDLTNTIAYITAYTAKVIADVEFRPLIALKPFNRF